MSEPETWAEESFRLIIKSGTFTDIIELVALLAGYLEEESQKGIKL